jgi:hypothetical protein
MAIYVKNEDLLAEILISLEKGELTPKALEMLMLIVDRASTKLKYNNEMDREDCKAFALFEVIKYWNRFKPEKSTNAFAYFTQQIKNGFAKGWDVLHPKRYKGTIRMSGSPDSPDGIFSL